MQLRLSRKLMAHNTNMDAKHDSVLVDEVLEALQVRSSDVVVDATLGGAGHFARLLSALDASGTLIGIDADSEAVERARAVLESDAREARPIVHLVHDNFRNLRAILSRLHSTHLDKALFDLGWSGYQVAAPRGFSFQKDEPLLMAYGAGNMSAAEIVNSSSEVCTRYCPRDCCCARQRTHSFNQGLGRRGHAWYARMVSPS
jgi:16S rRNA (cytosine1402-N4)-methyltransferase